MAEIEHADWDRVGAAFRAFGRQVSAAVKADTTETEKNAQQQLTEALSGLKDLANDPQATSQLKSATTELLDAITTEVTAGKDAISERINRTENEPDGTSRSQ